MIEITLDLSDMFYKLAKHKKFILLTCIICTVLAVIYAFIVDEYWNSSAVIRALNPELLNYPSSENEFSLITNSIFDEKAPVMGSLYLQELLRTRRFAEDTIAKFNLVEYFAIEESDSLKALDIALKLYKNKLLSVGFDPETELIGISALTKDKKLSVDIVNYQLIMLEIYNEQESESKHRKMREFLGERIGSIKEELNEVDNAIQKLQIEKNSYLLDEKVDFALDNYSKIFLNKIDVEIEYLLAKENSSEDNYKVKELAYRLELLEKKLQDFELSENGSGIFNSLDKIPELAYQYHKLERKQVVLEQTYNYLVPIYEITRINELNSIQSFEIIDKARESGLRSKPRRGLLIGFVTFLSLLLSCSYVIIQENFISTRDKG